jgi:NADPH:quinone reductase
VKRIRVHAFGGPEVLELEEVEDLRPDLQQVLIRVRAVGVNPYDTYARTGNYGARTPTLPFTPGSDAAGTVEAVGTDVNDIAPGDRVYTSGTLTGAYADLTLCKPSQVHPLPAQADFAQGAALFVPYTTAYRSLFQIARGLPSESVLIHGASGGVGLAAVQFARAAGMTIIGTAGSNEGLRLIREQGAGHAISHGAPNYSEDILRATNGRGVDVILEMLANVNLSQDLSMLAPHGRVVVIGSRGNINITPRDLMVRDASITGMMLWNLSEMEFRKINRAIYAGLENGSLRPIINLEIPLADAAEAHRRVMVPGAHLGKIILVP